MEPRLYCVVGVNCSALGAAMTEDRDRCPHCRLGFEIVVVKFAAFGVRAVLRCPNCGLSPIEQPAALTISNHLSRVKMLDTLNNRFKSIVGASLAAILVAGVLRHWLHVDAGISPDDIRSIALLLVAAVAIVVAFSKVFRVR